MISFALLAFLWLLNKTFNKTVWIIFFLSFDQYLIKSVTKYSSKIVSVNKKCLIFFKTPPLSVSLSLSLFLSMSLSLSLCLSFTHIQTKERALYCVSKHGISPAAFFPAELGSFKNLVLLKSNFSSRDFANTANLVQRKLLLNELVVMTECVTTYIKLFLSPNIYILRTVWIIQRLGIEFY